MGASASGGQCNNLQIGRLAVKLARVCWMNKQSQPKPVVLFISTGRGNMWRCSTSKLPCVTNVEVFRAPLLPCPWGSQGHLHHPVHGVPKGTVITLFTGFPMAAS